MQGADEGAYGGEGAAGSDGGGADSDDGPGRRAGPRLCCGTGAVRRKITDSDDGRRARAAARDADRGVFMAPVDLGSGLAAAPECGPRSAASAAERDAGASSLGVI